MHTFLFILLAALLVTILFTWAKGFSFHGSRPRRHARFTLLKELPFFTRSRLSFACLIARFQRRDHGDLLLANFNSSEHIDGKITFTADNAFTNAGQQAGRFLMAKRGTDDAHIDICGAADEPLGICTDAPASADVASVSILGAAKGTQRGIAAAAITADADVYTAAAGELQSEPTLAGTYWLVGRSVSPASGAHDDFEFTPIKPIRVIVLATLTSSQNATTAAIDLPTSEALANALKASYNQLQADVAALHTALAAPALIKWL